MPMTIHHYTGQHARCITLRVIAPRTTAGNDFTVCMEYFLHMRAGTFSPFASHTKGQTSLSDGRECPKEKGDMPCMPPFIFLMSFCAIGASADPGICGPGRSHATDGQRPPPRTVVWLPSPGSRAAARRAPSAAGQPPCERLRNAAALPEIKPIAEVCVSFTLRRAQ